MPIVVTCSCGKALKVPDMFAGKRVKCPSCNAIMTAPTTDDTPVAGQFEGPITSRPRPDRPAPALEPFEDRDQDDPRARRGKRPGKEGMGLGMVFGSLAILGLVAGGVGALLYYQGKTTGPTSADLDYVLGNSQGFATVRVAEAWKTPVVQAITEQLPLGEMPPNEAVQKHLGVNIEDVERVTFVLHQAEQKQLWVVISTTKPVDKGKILAGLEADTKETQHQGKVFHQVQGPDKPAVHFVNDRLFILAEEPAMRTCLEQTPRKDKTGPLMDLLAATNGPQHLVLGGIMPPEFVTLARTQLPAAILPLLETQTALLTATIGETSITDITLAFPDDGKSKAAMDALNTALTMAKGFMGMAKLGVGGPAMPGQKEMIAAAEETLKNLKVEQKGKDVLLSIKAVIDPKKIAEQMANLNPAFQVRAAADRTKNVNKLRQIGLAMHNYHDAYRAFPPAIIYSKDGQKPLYSWRVALLPFLEEDRLYQLFNKDEPWDSEHNRHLLTRMPRVFAQGDNEAEKSRTYFQVFTGKDAAFDGQKGKRMADFTDGTSNTILVAEAANGVQWSQPLDLPFNTSPLGFFNNRLGAKQGQDFLVLMADGSVRTLKRTVSPKTLQAAITINGGDMLGTDW